MAPSSLRDTEIGSATASDSEPFGPLTDTFWPSIVTSTPDGTGTGCFPIRDMSTYPSPHVCEDFAAHALTSGLTVGPEARGSGDDRHTKATQNPRKVGGFRVHPQTGLGHPAQARNAALPAGAVLQLYDKVFADSCVLDVKVGDVALALEDLRDIGLDLRVWQLHLVVVRRIGVAQTCQEVCDRVRHGHDSRFTFLAAVPTVPNFWGAYRNLFVSWSVEPLPAGLLHARQFAGVSHLAQADAAEPELAVNRVRAAALTAAGVPPHLEFGLLVGLVDQSLLRHLLSSP